MGYVDVAGVRFTLPDGRVLLDDVSFRVGEGACAALVGENGAGKTTLLRIISGDLTPDGGTVARTGGLGVMRQFIGSVRDDTTVQRFLVDLASPAVREAWDAVEAAELAMMEADDEPTQLAYANALGHWGDVGGYDVEV
ncbi:MAG: ATPase component of transporter with duplicated ATPase domain, partial [Modestobacter sp.]|nr:ATPase component of transporter with duplicated ATPase domain [Modestobacter sp.]